MQCADDPKEWLFVLFHGSSDSVDTFRGNYSANDDSNGIGGMLVVGRS